MKNVARKPIVYDDDDDDLEALRLAALSTMGQKRKFGPSGYRRQGEAAPFFRLTNNPNLIAIVPVEDTEVRIKKPEKKDESLTSEERISVKERKPIRFKGAKEEVQKLLPKMSSPVSAESTLDFIKLEVKSKSSPVEDIKELPIKEEEKAEEEVKDKTAGSMEFEEKLDFEFEDSEEDEMNFLSLGDDEDLSLDKLMDQMEQEFNSVKTKKDKKKKKAESAKRDEKGTEDKKESRKDEKKDIKKEDKKETKKEDKKETKKEEKKETKKEEKKETKRDEEKENIKAPVECPKKEEDKANSNGEKKTEAKTEFSSSKQQRRNSPPPAANRSEPLERKITPSPRRSPPASRRRSFSPRRWSLSPSPRRRGLSPYRDRSPWRWSPRRRSRTPYYRRSRSPIFRRTRSPVYRRSRSPPYWRNRSPAYRRSRSPSYIRTPPHRRSLSPRDHSPLYRRTPPRSRRTPPKRRSPLSPRIRLSPRRRSSLSPPRTNRSPDSWSRPGATIRRAWDNDADINRDPPLDHGESFRDRDAGYVNSVRNLDPVRDRDSLYLRDSVREQDYVRNSVRDRGPVFLRDQLRERDNFHNRDVSHTRDNRDQDVGKELSKSKDDKDSSRDSIVTSTSVDDKILEARRRKFESKDPVTTTNKTVRLNFDPSTSGKTFSVQSSVKTVKVEPSEPVSRPVTVFAEENDKRPKTKKAKLKKHSKRKLASPDYVIKKKKISVKIGTTSLDEPSVSTMDDLRAELSRRRKERLAAEETAAEVIEIKSFTPPKVVPEVMSSKNRSPIYSPASPTCLSYGIEDESLSLPSTSPPRPTARNLMGSSRLGASRLVQNALEGAVRSHTAAVKKAKSKFLSESSKSPKPRESKKKEKGEGKLRRVQIVKADPPSVDSEDEDTNCKSSTKKRVGRSIVLAQKSGLK